MPIKYTASATALSLHGPNETKRTGRKARLAAGVGDTRQASLSMTFRLDSENNPQQPNGLHRSLSVRSCRTRPAAGLVTTLLVIDLRPSSVYTPGCDRLATFEYSVLSLFSTPKRYAYTDVMEEWQ